MKLHLASGHELGKDSVCDVSIPTETRLKSVFVVGSPGSGKSALLETHIAQDVVAGNGFCVLDIEDRLTNRILRHLRDARRSPIVIDPTKGHVPLNILATPAGTHPHTVIEQVLQAFKRAWFSSWGERLEDLLKHSLMALQEQGLTLGELPRFISREAFRERVTASSTDEKVRLYFVDHVGALPRTRWNEWSESTRNKVASLMDNPFLSPSLSCEECIDFGALMDAGTPVIINLPEATLGDSGKLYAMLLITKLYQAALLRPKGSRPFYVYADEFASFATKVFVDLCTRLRKRGIGAEIAMQSISQPPFDDNPDFLNTILSTTGVHVIMQVGRTDAERFCKEVFPSSGSEAKRRSKHWLWGDHGEPKFYSVQEERELQCQEIETLQQRECFIKVKGKATYVAEAYELPEPISTEAEGEVFAQSRIEALAMPLDDIQDAQAVRLARFSPRRKQGGDKSPLDAS